MHFARTLLLPVFLLVACQGTPAPQRPTEPKEVTLTTKDGLRLAAHWYPADTSAGPRPALLMLHGGNQRKERWAEAGVIADLRPDNYHCLAVDIRGRGGSEAGDKEQLRRNPTLAREDLRAALKWLRARDDVDAGRIALLGSSYGANLVCAGQLGWGVEARATVCFSVTRAHERWLELGAGETEGEIRHGLFLACEDEPERYDAAGAAERKAKACTEGGEAKVFPGRAHALWIYEQIPESRPLVREYLRGQLARD